MVEYLKIGQASDLTGKDRKFYRFLEMCPGFFSWGTLLILFFGSIFLPVWAAFFIIAFDVYWLLLVAYFGVLLIAAYRKLKINAKKDWRGMLNNFDNDDFWKSEVGKKLPQNCLARKGMRAEDLIHLIIMPMSYEGFDILKPTMQALIDDGCDTKRMIMVLATEERAGEPGQIVARKTKEEFGDKFSNFLITVHPDGIAGELKGKGANQAWGGKIVKEKIIDKEELDYDKILVSVLDCDTVVSPGYFSCLTYKFLTVESPYRTSYQPVPFYYNNVWEDSFFARVAASSNTFWQMMQQIRHEKLATYSSHSMTWRALDDVGFWSTTMVSEDSRIFWHCFCYYNGDYRVEPMNFPISMDATMDASTWKTIRSLYVQQRRWGWGAENLPYLIFNMTKKWNEIPRGKFISRLLVQIYGFHSWATNALIIGVIGWMPVFLGGDSFNSTVLSGNLPTITRTLMTLAMGGMVLSAIMSSLLLPQRPHKYNFFKSITMLLQWIILPISIVIFGAIPGLEAQTRLILNKRLGFQVTPKGDAAKEGHDWDQS